MEEEKSKEEVEIVFDDPILLGACDEWLRRTYPEQ